MWAPFSTIRGSIPPSIHTDNSHLSSVIITLVLVKARSLELNNRSAKGETENIIMDPDTVDPVAPDQGVGEPVEQVGQGQEGHAVVGGIVPTQPGFVLNKISVNMKPFLFKDGCLSNGKVLQRFQYSFSSWKKNDCGHQMVVFHQRSSSIRGRL